jgi:hypothetical protein
MQEWLLCFEPMTYYPWVPANDDALSHLLQGRLWQVGFCEGMLPSVS